MLKKLWNQITGDLHVHRWHPTFALVESMLLEAGFRNIIKCKFRESALAEIHLLENREIMTFYIEGSKLIEPKSLGPFNHLQFRFS